MPKYRYEIWEGAARNSCQDQVGTHGCRLLVVLTSYDAEGHPLNVPLWAVNHAMVDTSEYGITGVDEAGADSPLPDAPMLTNLQSIRPRCTTGCATCWARCCRPRSGPQPLHLPRHGVSRCRCPRLTDKVHAEEACSAVRASRARCASGNARGEPYGLALAISRMG